MADLEDLLPPRYDMWLGINFQPVNINALGYTGCSSTCLLHSQDAGNEAIQANGEELESVGSPKKLKTTEMKRRLFCGRVFTKTTHFNHKLEGQLAFFPQCQRVRSALKRAPLSHLHLSPFMYRLGSDSQMNTDRAPVINYSINGSDEPRNKNPSLR
ncbi:hypothetical protein CDAR_168271 [Caerostris darwini]|uniref:Uncharacterized protein n=1 Tax=Caerostris darwini TaxID=1538125 RepID=A0AAV4T870_9ARAC|nr:hypothetical protein CDAR_168271 [Caerostris darwini]